MIVLPLAIVTALTSIHKNEQHGKNKNTEIVAALLAADTKREGHNTFVVYIG